MIQYSDEQLQLIETPFIPGHRRNVKAYSGCGKSTSLIGYANASGRDRKKILYLAFNKSVAQEAAQKFPKHVECLTMHGLAYRDVVKNVETFRERLAQKISGADFLDSLRELAGTAEELQVLSYLAYRTFEKWCNSDHDSISYESMTPEVNESAAMAGISPDVVIRGALNILNEMYNGTLAPVSHSFYLKIFQLKKPVLPYDVIMVDEAQDLNPVVMSILNHQPAELIKVGDPHQAIYSFRDALNSLNDDSIETHYLTHTYRFGQNLADAASKILMNWKGADKPLVGHGSVVDINQHDKPAPDIPMFINRTKAGVLEVLIDHFFNGHESDKAYLPGGKNSYGFNELGDAYSLFKKGEGRGSTAQFGSWKDYEDYAELTGCPNATTTIALINRYKGAVPACISKLSERTTGSIKKADYAVTTGHKSKGLEHPYVIVGNDFPNILKRPVDEQEINLMYVAITRAEQKLDYGINIKNLLKEKTSK